MPYVARFINPLRIERPGRDVWTWELLLSDDGSDPENHVLPVRAPVKYLGKPQRSDLLQSVRQIARRIGSATVAQAGGITSISVDLPVQGTTVWHEGDAEPAAPVVGKVG